MIEILSRPVHSEPSLEKGDGSINEQQLQADTILDGETMLLHMQNGLANLRNKLAQIDQGNGEEEKSKANPETSLGDESSSIVYEFGLEQNSQT